MKRILSFLFAVTGVAAFAVTVESLDAIVEDHAPVESVKWLQTYWRAASGKTLRLQKSDAPLKNNAIYLGDAALKKGLITQDEIAKAGPDGFVLKITKDTVAVAAQNPWGVLCGVGRLGELLGLRPLRNTFCRFKPVPRELSECVIMDSPAFSWRNGFNPLTGQLGGQMLADPRNGADPELFDPKKTKSDLWIDHTAGYLVPKLKYYDAHPEYYAMLKDGKRIAKDSFSDHRTPLCLSNPDVTRISIERAREWVRKNPTKKYFYITYGDTSFWCQCPECLKLDEKPNQYAARLLLWVNAVAKALEPEFPDHTFLTFAYGGSNERPETVRPHDNVAVVAASSLGNLPFFAHDLKSGNVALASKLLEDWLIAGKQKPLICEYVGDTYQPAFVAQTADRYRYLKKRGFAGIAFNYGNPVNFPYLWWYLHGKLLWNPDQDAMRLTEEYAPCLYGAAAPHIISYLKLADAQYQKTFRSGKKQKNHYPEDFYTQDFISEACQLFDRAIQTKGIPEQLQNELILEKYRMLTDAMKHLSDYNNPKLVGFVLKEGNQCAEHLKKKMEFAQSNNMVLRDLEKTLPPATILSLKKQIGKVTAAIPEKTSSGWRFPVAMWNGQDYGPAEYGSKQDPLSPPRICAGVFTKAKGGRFTSSSEMSLVFDLPEADANREATLSFEGQDAINKTASANHLKNKEVTTMKITLNDTVIYDGECGFVLHNWSRREFNVPKGVLKKENNVLVIQNTGYARGAFVYCWVLISDAQLNFIGNAK